MVEKMMISLHRSMIGFNITFLCPVLPLPSATGFDQWKVSFTLDLVQNLVSYSFSPFDKHLHAIKILLDLVYT